MRRNKYGLFLLIILVSPIPALFMSAPTTEITPMEVSVLSNGVTPFDRGPTVNMVTNESAVIFWRTDDLTNATVRYGLDMSLSESVSNSSLDTDHLVTLSGLAIDSKYYYRAISNGTLSPVYHFLTAPADGDEFKMIIIGDNRPGTTLEQPEVFSQLAQMIVAEEPHIVIHTGDYVMEVEDNHEENLLMWEYYTNISDGIGHYAPIYGVIGNHDSGIKTGSLKPEYFLDAFVQYGEPSLNYSFDYAGVHFACLTTEEPGYEGRIVGDQLAWLENDLASTNRKMKFVVQHRPLVPVAHIDDSWKDIPAADRDALQTLYEEQNVSLIITGHDHNFNRLTLNGITQIIAGGGGAPIYDHPTWGGGFYHYVRTNVSSGHINITAIKPDGTVGHNYQIPYDGPIEIEHRIIPTGATKPVGTMPVIFFSEVPAEKYFSWDGGVNQTELTGIPNENGEHTLDIYAKNADDVWSHVQYTFIGTGATTPPPTGGAIDPLLILGGVSVAGVVVVVAVLWIRKK